MIEKSLQEAIDNYTPSIKILNDLVEGYEVRTEVLYREPYRAPELFDSHNLFKQFIEHELKTTANDTANVNVRLDKTYNYILIKGDIPIEHVREVQERANKHIRKDLIKFLGMFKKGKEPNYSVNLVLNNDINMNGMSVSVDQFIHILHGFLNRYEFKDLFNREIFVILDNRGHVFENMTKYVEKNKSIVKILGSNDGITKVSEITPKRVAPKDDYEKSVLLELNQHVA